jgi:hypothetical protein
MGLKVSGPDEVTVDRPELLAGSERAHQLMILVKGLLNKIRNPCLVLLLA